MPILRKLKDLLEKVGGPPDTQDNTISQSEQYSKKQDQQIKKQGIGIEQLEQSHTGSRSRAKETAADMAWASSICPGKDH